MRQTNSSDERDFAQLTALEVNRMGVRRLYLVAVPWSSAHRTRNEHDDFEKSFANVELRMGDRSTTLAQHRGDIAELGLGQSLLPLPIPGTQQLFFPIERADLSALASSERVQLIALGEPDSPQLYKSGKTVVAVSTTFSTSCRANNTHSDYDARRLRDPQAARTGSPRAS